MKHVNRQMLLANALRHFAAAFASLAEAVSQPAHSVKALPPRERN